jgi:hypothetical protein
MINYLIIPRPITRLVLLSVGIFISWLAWTFLPIKLLAYSSGIIAPYCLLIAGAVWSMRDKADSAFDGEALTSDEYRRSRKAASALRKRSMALAMWTAFLALLAGSAAISEQVSGTIWLWMVVGAGVASAEASYSYLLAYQWEEQLRSIYERKRLSLLRRSEIDSLKGRASVSDVLHSDGQEFWPIGENKSKIKKHH